MSNRLKEAEAAARRALALDPQQEFAQQLLEWIRERREASV